MNAPRVGLHAALDPTSAGGVQTNLVSLVHALEDRTDVAATLLATPPVMQGWRNLVAPQVTVAEWPHPIPWYRPDRPQHRSWLDRWWREPRAAGARDSLLRHLGVELVHFPYQLAFDTAHPSIYEPWDLQHLKLPEFFTPGERDWRTAMYRRACERAEIVATATAATKRDLVDAFGVPKDKIAVIYRDSQHLPSPPPPERRAVILAELGLAPGFVFYPAMAFPHKNHARLLEAFALLKERIGTALPLVLSGRPVQAQQDKLEASAAGRGLDVRFASAVSDEVLATLFSEARLLVFPSLFEGLGLPLLEAMQAGLPIAASDASCIPEVVGDAAILFDPTDPNAIADAVWRLWSDPALRSRLVSQGFAQRTRFSWDEAGSTFAAVYKKVARRRLDADDRRRLDKALAL